MLPEKRPPHVAQAHVNTGHSGPRIPIYPVCERIWRDAVRLLIGGETRQLIPLLAYRNHLSERQVVTILLTTGIAYERTATTWKVGMFNTQTLADESSKAVWSEMRGEAA